jgi:hypothetical protein
MKKEAIGLFFLLDRGTLARMSVFRLFPRTFLVGCCLLWSNHLYAVDLGSFGDRIFQFQEKLANNGNKLAQYKLGTLYEFGVSVEPNIEQARLWYKKAASQDFQPAIDRLTYLDVKQNGYDEEKHGVWFERVLKEVEANEADALILLGQMNRYGIVVDQNINLAVGLLQRASSLGHTEVDSQIDELKREIRAAKRQRREAEKKQEVAKAKLVEKRKPEPVVQKTSKPKVNKQAEMEAKRRRYEEAMRKLYKETLLLQQQQEWAESVPAVE